MISSISNGVNEMHRSALNKAINVSNSKWFRAKAQPNVLILVGTKNIIVNIFTAIFSKDSVFLYFTGFGRLYTDFGFFGKCIFFILILTSSLRQNRHYIVENKFDRRIIAQLSKRRVTQINGSGFNKSLYPIPAISSSKSSSKVIGYMSRFGPSKCTDEVIKLITALPPEYSVIVAGKDITGTKFSDKFFQIAQKNTQVEMLGFLETPNEVSSFFNKINVLLYPSLREGLPITLLESVYHRVPFLTTNVAGCIDLSEQFGFPTCAPEYFGEQKTHLDIPSWGLYSPRWDDILTEYSEEKVQKNFETMFLEKLQS